MEDHIKTFKKRLRDLGFKRKTERVYWYDNNGLFYMVSFNKAGRTTGHIGFEVSHADMFKAGAPPEPGKGPVGGLLGNGGVRGLFGAEFAEAFSPDADVLERAVRDFFTYFKTAADWQTAVRGLREQALPPFPDIPLPSFMDISIPPFTAIPIRPDAGGAPVPWFVNDAADEMRTQRDFQRAVDERLAVPAQRAGFRNRGNGDFMCRRGDMYDCFSLICDDLGTFCRATLYFWSDMFVKRDWPSPVDYAEDFLPAAGWIRTGDFLRDPRLVDEFVEEVSAYCRQYRTGRDWLAHLERKADFFEPARGLLPRLEAKFRRAG